jgi:hypothetical protein
MQLNDQRTGNIEFRRTRSPIRVVTRDMADSSTISTKPVFEKLTYYIFYPNKGQGEAHAESIRGLNLMSVKLK